jgi:AcrR family transcriptional regulator
VADDGFASEGQSPEKMIEGGLGGEPTRQLGRKRDHTRNGDILDAAIEVLAEVGYDRMTMDMVAMRAKAGKATIYRRWPSKARLVLDAVTRMKRGQVDLDNLPDTGTLRGDLLALFKPQSIEEGERKLRVMAGFASMLSQDRELADAGNAAIVEPWAAAHRTLIGRAIERGEVVATADTETVAQVIPSMAAYRALIQRKPFDRDFLIAMIDGVLLPALHRSPTAAEDLDRSST